MKRFEYIRLYFDPGDLEQLNGLGSAGWEVVSVTDRTVDHHENGDLLALLKRAHEA